MRRLMVAVNFLLFLTVSAYPRSYCLVQDDAYTDAILKAMRAISDGKPACPEVRKAEKAAQSLKILWMEAECYSFGKDEMLQREQKELEKIRTGYKLYHCGKPTSK
jgi:hypothetical protein